MQIEYKKHNQINMINSKFSKNSKSRSICKTAVKKDEGFSLVEVVISLVILLVTVMGVFITFTYAVNYNAGNKSRSEALAILQQEVENMRSAKFTPAISDSTLLGGTRVPKTVFSPSNNSFRIDITVDDDLTTAGVQTNNATTMKEINVTVTLNRPTPGWQTAVPATVVLLRVRSN